MARDAGGKGSRAPSLSLASRWRAVAVLLGLLALAASVLAVRFALGPAGESAVFPAAVVLGTVGWWLALWTRRIDQVPEAVQRVLVARPLLPIYSLVAIVLAGEMAFLAGDGFGYVTPRHRSGYETSMRGGGKPFTFHGSTWNRREFAVPVAWNSMGYADREYARDKPAGTRRILILGDSFVEGLQVSLDDRFPNVLEDSLGQAAPTQVIALGRGGWGQVYELAVLIEQGLPLRPDLVVVCFLARNDVTDNLDRDRDPLFLASNEMYLDPVYDALARAELQFLPFVYKKAFDVLRGADQRARFDRYSPFAQEYAEEIEEGWQRTFEAFRRIDTACRMNRVPLLVFSITEGIDLVVPPGMDPDKPDRLLEAFCRSERIEFRSMRHALLVDPERYPERLRWNSDDHWNRAGHRAAAAILEEGLAEHFPDLR